MDSEKNSSPTVVTVVELLADADGTFGARWNGEHVGATWDHANWDSVLTGLHYAIDAPQGATGR